MCGSKTENFGDRKLLVHLIVMQNKTARSLLKWEVNLYVKKIQNYYFSFTEKF